VAVESCRGRNTGIRSQLVDAARQKISENFDSGAQIIFRKYLADFTLT